MIVRQSASTLWLRLLDFGIRFILSLNFPGLTFEPSPAQPNGKPVQMLSQPVEHFPLCPVRCEVRIRAHSAASRGLFQLA